jgi:predicted Zn-dependent protease
MSSALSTSGWHPASHPVSRARIEAVAARAEAESRPVQQAPEPAYFQARPTRWHRNHTGGRPPVPLVAVCPDGKVEHYASIVEAAEAMDIWDGNSIWRALDKKGMTCRDRRWYRAGTYEEREQVAHATSTARRLRSICGAPETFNDGSEHDDCR